MVNARLQLLQQEKTREMLTKSRNAQLCAIANHHARVSHMAIDMANLCRPPTWHTETLEYLAAEISESFTDAFGRPLIDDDLRNKTDAGMDTELDRLRDIVSRAYQKLSCVAIERSCESTPEIVRICDQQAMGILSEGLRFREETQ